MEALAMDGHGVYVWSVYLVSVVLLIALGLYPLLSLRHLKRKRSNHGDVE